MNRKQLFMNPAETNAHGSIRTAKWAKGAVAVVALSGAFGVASMNTTTASADEIQTEVVAPTATEDVATTPTETVAAEQPVVEVAPVIETSAQAEEVTSVGTPVAEVATAVEEVAPVAESAVVAEAVAEAPVETATTVQPAVETANDTSSETSTSDVTAAEVVTNAGKEIARSDYEVTAKLDTENEYSETKTISRKSPTNELNLKITDSTNINAGDTITLTTQNTPFRSGEVLHADGTKVADLIVTQLRANSRAVAEAVGNGTTIQDWETITHENAGVDFQLQFVFTDAASNYDSLDLTFIGKAYSLLARTSEDSVVPIRIKDANGAVIAEKYSRTEYEPATGTEKLDSTYMGWGTPTEYNLSEQSGSINDNVTRNLVIINLDNPGEIGLLKAGTIFTYDLTQGNDQFVIKAVDPVAPGTVIERYSGGVLTFDGSPQNSQGYWRNPENPNKYEVLENTDGKLVLKLLNDFNYTDHSAILPYDFTLKSMDSTTVDPATGELLVKPTVNWTISAPDGTTISKSQPISLTYVGTWSSADGAFTPKYVSSLNAVLEDGTVIKENMDATGLLKVGKTFTLDADSVIEYNGIKYSPIDGITEVNGTTIDKAQVLTKVYYADPKLNHAFVDLTVNHIDKETGVVMKTTTTNGHEETTTYTTNAETFPEYNLVATPDNATGTFGKDAVVVNYYYIHKKGNVVAKFVREDGAEIAPVVNVVTNVNTGTDYTATHPAEIAFDGTVYRYTSTDGTEAGKVTEGTTTITNRYVLVKGTLIEKYVDVNGAEIKAQNTVLDDAPVKTAYSLEHPNEIQANGTTYRYVRTNGSETGQLVEGTTVVTYIYDTVKGDVVAKFVREDGTEIAPVVNVVTNVNTGTDYTATHPAEIAFDGTVYRYTSTDGSEAGKVTEGTITITNRYVLVKGTLIEKYVDVNGAEIKAQNTVLDDAPVKTAYSLVHPNEIQANGTTYRYVRTNGSETGQLVEGTTVVTYIYDTVKGDVVAKFVREDGTEIAPVVNVVTNVNTGTDYTATHPAEIAFDGTVYRYTSTDGSEAGKVTEGTTTITNRYVLVKGTLIEKYVDVNGAEIKAQNTVLDDAPIKTAYSLEHPNEIQANGTTYRYVRTDGSETGQLVEGTTVVTYIYDTVKGDVVVKVVDAETGNDIFPAETVVDDKPITKTIYDVTSYNKARITGKDGKTWDFVSVDGNQTGKVVEGVTTITFKYNEVKTSVTTKLVSTDGKELRSPSTDADLSTGVTYNTISKAPEVIYATDNNVYKRTAIPSNSQGVTTVDPITVTYVYELQTAEPTKTIASTDGRDLTGKVLLAGDNVVYNFSTDLAKFKGIDGLSTEDKHHALIIVEDIADEFLTPNMSQASVSSGKAFLNYYSSIDEAPESIKSVLSAKKVSTTGGFAVLTSFNPLATAEEIKAQNLAFFNEFTNKGLNVSVVLPTTVNATVDNAKIENKVIQIDFDGVTESPVVVNETPDINPTKDIVLNAGDEESLQGKQITVGTVFNYELNGTIYPANRGNKLTSYQQVDKHSDKVLPTGVYLTKATAEIQFEDGYKLGDEIIIPAGTVVKGSWVTPVDIVSDKDGSVIKAGSTVVKDGSPQVEYTIEKDIVVAAGTDVTGIVFPIGSDFSAIFRQFIDAENNTVTYSMRQDAFEKISADSAFGFTTYMQVEQIAAGTTENTYTEIVNGVETKSNTVTHEGVDPEVPGGDTPTPSTPVVNTPGIPADAPVSTAGVATLPNTGEENSSAAALAGAAMLVATLGLAGRRRKEEK